MNARTLTEAVESETEPGDFMLLLADPRTIPAWAPAFADTVREASEGHWLATKGRRSFTLRTAVSEESRTVDYLREVIPGEVGGAYIRILQRPGGGSVVVMTLPTPAGSNRLEIAATLRAELEGLERLVSGVA